MNKRLGYKNVTAFVHTKYILNHQDYENALFETHL